VASSGGMAGLLPPSAVSGLGGARRTTENPRAHSKEGQKVVLGENLFLVKGDVAKVAGSEVSPYTLGRNSVGRKSSKYSTTVELRQGQNPRRQD